LSASVLRRLALAAALPPLLFALVTLRTLSRGEAALTASDRAFDAGQLELAVRYARRAATAYVPGAAHVDAAFARLRAVAVGAERAREIALAASAWQAVRAAALEIRHVGRPRARELEQANANLARLQGLPSALSTPASPAEVLQPGWALVLGAGFFTAVGSLAWFCTRAWTATGHWRTVRAGWPALGWCAGVGVLAWALLHA
jgi:hypothetical protein